MRNYSPPSSSGQSAPANRPSTILPGSSKLIIFDLDGTLVDSAEDIGHSMNALLTELGQPTLAQELICSYIGDGVRKLLERSLPDASPATVDHLQDRYLEIYRAHLLDRTRPYPGVAPGLAALAPGRRLTVLTNKPRRESLMILEGLGLDRFFEIVYGGDSFDRRKPDPLGVERIVGELGVSYKSTLFVGDSPVDRETARNAKIPFCLVSYGLGSAAAAALAPELTVDDLRELASVLGEEPK